MIKPVDSKNLPVFQKELLRWYDASARDLPWRRTQDPYKIWVSEIMLQQTQVDTVIPYYEKWLKRFPTLSKLAAAPLSEALKYWAGLGYYRRARMLHEAAQCVMKNHKGKIPSTADALMELPGIGRYTAGAIASIAFDQKAPLLDGNVIRILSRIYAVAADVSLPATISKLWKLSEGVLPEKRIGDFNQALMELGATVCFPDNPACLLCPVSKHCSARATGREKSFPVKLRKEKLEKKNTAALILREKDAVLIQQQGVKDRWGGLWMFPHWEDKKQMIKNLGIDAKELNHRLTIQHGFTKYQIQLDVYEWETQNDAKIYAKHARRNDSLILGHSYAFNSRQILRPFRDSSRWVKIGQLKKFAFPAPHQKIVKELLKK